MPPKKNIKNNQGESMDAPNIIQAAEFGFVDNIDRAVSMGVSVDHQEASTGITALHVAAARCQKNAVVRLIELGADPNIRDNFNRTALDVASATSRTDISLIIYEAMYPENFSDPDPLP